MIIRMTAEKMRITMMVRLVATALVLVALFPSPTSIGGAVDAAAVLQTLPLYDDELLISSSRPSRAVVPGEDAVSSPPQPQQRRQGNLNVINETLRHCHLIDMTIHSIVAPSGRRVSFGGSSGFAVQTTAAISLALEHLNTGNGRVIPEVQGLNDRCNIKFTAEFTDTAALESIAVDNVIDILARTSAMKEVEANSNTTMRSSSGPPPCAFIGAFGSQPSMSTALLTSLKGFPQFSGLSQASQLDDPTLFPLFGRFVPSNDNYALPLVDFLVNQLNVRHLAVVFSDDSRSISFLNGLRRVVVETEYASQLQITTAGFADEASRRNDSKNDYAAVVAALKASGYRYILAVVRETHFQPLIEEAYRQGIAGNSSGMSFNWIVTTGLVLPDKWPKNSTFAQSIAGLMEFIKTGALPGIARYDEFFQAWQELGNANEDMAYLQNKLPVPVDDDGVSSSSYQPPNVTKDSFVSNRFTNNCAKLYDISIALGLAACAAATDVNTNDNIPLTGQSHYEKMLETSFVGASGKIKLDPATGSRDATSALFLLNNYVPISIDGDDDAVMFRKVEAHRYESGQWKQLEQLQFNDGTTNVPPDLPPPDVEYNYIGNALRVVGFAMSIVAMLLSISFSLWSYFFRNIHVVTASQPIFLHIICLGTFLMAVSIIPINIDDEIASESGMDVACMTFPWLVSTGWCFAFSALFTKTLRINKIFHNPRFRRLTVTAHSVTKPMISLLSVNVLVLTLWTVLSPLQWRRQVVALDVFDRPMESQGECTTDDGTVFVFISLLLLINIGSLAFAVRQAYVARKISTEYAESEWIGRSMTTIMVVVFVSVPVLVIAREDTQAFSFVFSLIMFLISISLNVFIFLPKVLTHCQPQPSPTSAAVARGWFGRQSSLGSNGMLDESASLKRGGSMVLQHPKFQEYLENKVTLLSDENEKLKERLALLEKQLDNDTTACANQEDQISSAAASDKEDAASLDNIEAVE